MYLKLCWPKPPMPLRSQMHLYMCWTKSLHCKRGHIMHLNMYPFDKMYFKFKPIPRKQEQQMYRNICWPNTKKKSQHRLTKPRLCQRRHKMLVKMCWPYLSQVSEDTKCSSNSIDLNSHIKARTQNVSQHMLTKRISFPWAYKLHGTCWPNPFHAGEESKCILTCFDKTPSVPTRPQNVSIHELTKRLPCQSGQKMYLMLCWPIPFHTSGDLKCITCVDQTDPMPERTQNLSQLVFTKPIPRQQWHKMYLYLCWANPSNSSEDTKCILISDDWNTYLPEKKQVFYYLCCPNPTYAMK